MFDKRSDLVRFLAVVDVGAISLAADRLAMAQPALTRVIARLERQFAGKLFERLPKGVRLTALGTTAAELARGILREFEAAENHLNAARTGHAGTFRITAGPMWACAVLPETIARYHQAFPHIELRIDTVTRAEGLRRLAIGESDLHCGGIDDGRRLPDFLRSERFLDVTTGIVAHRDHPLLARRINYDDLARCAWIDYDASPGPGFQPAQSALTHLLARLNDRTSARVRTIVHTNSPNLLLMTSGPYLAWLSTEFLDRLPGQFLRPLPVAFGRYRFRSGFVVRRATEDIPPFRRFEALLRQTALKQHE